MAQWFEPGNIPDKVPLPDVVRRLNVVLNRLTLLLGRTPTYSAYRAVTTSGAVLDSDDLIAANATGGAITMTLPAAINAVGRRFTLKKTDATANAVIFDGNGAETIDGSATLSNAVQYAAYTVQSDGTQWWIV